MVDRQTEIGERDIGKDKQTEMWKDWQKYTEMSIRMCIVQHKNIRKCRLDPPPSNKIARGGL